MAYPLPAFRKPRARDRGECHLTHVDLLARPNVYLAKMTRSPAEIRAQAETYRELHAYLRGPILTQAIEDVAIALDRLAAAVEWQDEAARDPSRPALDFR